MPTVRLLAALVVLAASVALGACNWSDSNGGPVGNSSPPPPSQSAATEPPALSAAPSPMLTLAPTPGTTAIVYYEATKNAEGGHGGPPLLDLPASIAIDYTVNGTCEFTIGVFHGVPDNGIAAAKLAMRVTGHTTSGTWPVSLVPGRYYVNPGEAVGCTFNVRVYGT